MKKDITKAKGYYKPFHYEWAEQKWLTHEQVHWLHTEVPLHEDVKEWKRNLTPSQRVFLTNIFKFFTQGDIDVAGGYTDDYLPFIKNEEVRGMMTSFSSREIIHVRGYSHLIDTLGMNQNIYKEFLDYKEMVEKHDIYKTLECDNELSTFALKIAAFSGFTEGVQLFSSFVMLLNFPKNGLLRGMGTIVAYSIKDESLHCDGMIEVFKTFVKENKKIWNDHLKGKIYTLATQIVELEDNFIDLCYGTNEDMFDLNKEDVKQYIRYITDRRLIQMMLKPIFGVKDNPLPWVDGMTMAVEHANFFENRVSEYMKGTLTGSWDDVFATEEN